MPTILSNSVQNVRRNSYASSSRLDLTLICNGEEPNQLFDSTGGLTLAGIIAPTAAATVSGTGVSEFFSYVYVYAATSRFPFVQNTVAAGGNVSPRSNPSPSVIANYNYASSRTLTIPCSTDLRVNKIWVYRTTSSTSADNTLFSEAGLFFYVGEVENDPTVTSATFIDLTTVAADVGEQVEYDNLVAPASTLCCYSDPYFYMIGSSLLEFDVNLRDDAIIEIVTEGATWPSGRTGQYVKLAGVDTGGLDGAGTFYFQWLTETTAQLTDDYAGVTDSFVGYIGTTRATIYSSATTLYRSKPNNPLAWGETIAISSLALPRLWTLKLDGGVATALTTLPNTSLLKIDLIGPSRSYVLNTKLQGQEGFRESKRTVSEVFSASSQALQFTCVDQRGQSQLVGLDLNNKVIFQCNGESHIPIGGNLIDLIREISLENIINYHGIYDPNTECFFIWIKEAGELTEITKAIVYHGPTGQWSILLDFDITASAIFTDTVSGETMILGGSATGHFGQLFKPDKFINWLSDPVEAVTPMSYPISSVQLYPKEVSLLHVSALITTAEDHLSYCIVYFHDAAGVEQSFFIYLDVGTTGDSAPAASANYDNLLRVNIAVGASSATLHIAIRTAWDISYSAFADADIGDDDECVLTSAHNIVLQDSSEYEQGTFNGTLTTVYSGGIGLRPLVTSPGFSQIADSQLPGTWVLVETASNGMTHFWGRVRELNTNSGIPTYFLDRIYPQDSYAGASIAQTTDLNIYFGLIECGVFKSFDLADSNKNKSIKEVWMAGKEAIRTYSAGGITYYNRKLLLQSHAQLDETPTLATIPKIDKKNDGTTEIEMYFATVKTLASNPFKTFGLSWKQRGYSEHEMRNVSLTLNG